METKLDKLRKLFIMVSGFKTGEESDSEEIELSKTVLSDVDMIQYLLTEVADKDYKTSLKLYMFMVESIYRTNGIDIIPDETYDRLYEMAKNRGVEPNTEQVGKSTGGKYSHTYPELRGTLGKIHFGKDSDRGPDDERASLEEFLRSVSRETKISVDRLYDRTVNVSLKIDGISAIFECDKNGVSERVLKRGDVERNLADRIPVLERIHVGGIMKEMPGEPFGLKTEVAMTRDMYKRICDEVREFESPRSAVTSIVNSKDLNENRRLMEYLTVYPLQYKTTDSEVINVYNDELTDAMTVRDLMENFENVVKRYQEELSIQLEIPADGIVIGFIDDDIVNTMGRRDEVNRYEIAYKFPPTQKQTKLLDVEFSTGILGGITPVAKVEPIEIDGHTIDSPSLGSIRRFESLRLKRGQNVTIRYDVIPYLIPIYDELYANLDGKIDTIEICVSCSQTLTKVNDELYCNNLYCMSVSLGRVQNYIEKMNIAHISVSTLDKLYLLGLLSDIPGLYTLKMHEKSLMEVEGFGKKSVERILNEIDNSKKAQDYDFYGSLGIRSIGRTVLKRIFEHYPSNELIHDILDGTYPRKGRPYLFDINGVGPTMESLVMKMGEEPTRGIIETLILGGIIELDVYTPSESRGTITFTKVRDKELESLLVGMGYELSDKYTKKVDIVVVPSEDTVSSKVTKGRKDGKKIFTVVQLMEYLKTT